MGVSYARFCWMDGVLDIWRLLADSGAFVQLLLRNALRA